MSKQTLKVMGTVDIVNSLAHSAGFGGRSKLGRACKGVVHVRVRADGRQFLVVSTRKDATAYEYDVKCVKKIRNIRASEGFATFEISQPPMNIMLRNCEPEELQKFISDLQTLIGKQIATGISNATESTPPSSGSTVENGDAKETPGSLRRNNGSLKRPRSPELSKSAAAKVQKTLRTENTSISVKSRDKYPKEFVETLEQVKINTVGLKVIDRRLLRLKWLTLLDLTGNKLKEIHQLANLNCSLLSLVLAKNEIGSIPDDLFSHSAFRKLKNLDLTENQLTRLPSSVIQLTTVFKASFSHNHLNHLPYNWQDMKYLRVLDVSGNSLMDIPKPIVDLQLTKLDMSGNTSLQCPPDSSDKYFGSYDVPDLFELSCEAVMNFQRKKKLLSTGLLPAIIENYLQRGKYCCFCGKLVLRFKTTTTSVSPQQLSSGGLSACLISPAAPCNVKTVKCVECNARYQWWRGFR